MQLVTANQAESRAWSGWTRHVRIVADGRIYIEKGLRVGSDLLVSPSVRLFQDVSGGEVSTFTRHLLHINRANVEDDGDERVLTPNDCCVADIMVFVSWCQSH